MTASKSAGARKGKAFKRADSSEQKKERRQLLLRVAAQELAKGGADDFTIETVAKAAGLAKGTVYLYFPSKDALIFALTTETFFSFLRDVLARLGALPQGAGPQAVAFAIYEAIDRVQARRLLRSLNEMRQDQIVFVKEILPLVEQCDALFRVVLPGLRPGDGRIILRYGWALCLGISEIIQGRAAWSKEEREVARRSLPYSPSFKPLRMESGVVDGLTLIIEGYLRRAGN